MGWRKANALAAAGLTLLFLAHELLGALWMRDVIGRDLAFLVWLGVAGALVHALMCVATSRSMLRDAVRPPSRRKKRHLALKWATGALLALAAGAHAAWGLQAAGGTVLAGTGVLAAVLLAVHACTGARSLTSDLGLSPAARRPGKVIVAVLTAVGCLCAIA